MSVIGDDQGSARLGPQRRYRIAGGAPRAAGLDEHVEDLAAGYALGALDADDRARVERHVRLCPACAGLLDEERRVVALLPLAAAPAAPAPDVKVALFARIAHTQRVAATADLPASRTRALPPTLTIPSSRAALPAVEAAAAVAPAPWVEPRPERSSWLGRIGAFATVPLMLALVATGAWAFRLQDRVSESTGQVQNLEATLANLGSGTQLPLYGDSATSGEQGQLLIGNDQRLARVQMQLAPDPDRAYELVGVREGQVVDITDLEVDDQGQSQMFPVAEPFETYEQIEVRAQPVGSEAEGDTVLSADPNGAIGSGDPTSNSGAP